MAVTHLVILVSLAGFLVQTRETRETLIIFSGQTIKINLKGDRQTKLFFLRGVQTKKLSLKDGETIKSNFKRWATNDKNLF